MGIVQLKEHAEGVWKRFKTLSYVGRVVVVGLNIQGDLVIVVCMTGRSDKSKNRLYSHANGRLFTEIADPSLLTAGEDTSLIIYDAMEEVHVGRRMFIASNGKQTTAVRNSILREGLSHVFEKALADFSYEPDSYHTPRITAMATVHETGEPTLEMAILKKSAFTSFSCDRRFFTYGALHPGFGHCLTTYEGGEDPSESFQGEPRLVPLVGSAQEIANCFWNALNPQNVISVGVKVVPLDGKGVPMVVLRNRFNKKVG